MRMPVLMLCLPLALVVATVAVASLAVDVQVAPAQIVLNAPSTWLTVHADIAYSAVQEGTVYINGLDADRVFPDDCGNLVAKVEMERIKELVEPPSAEITLTGLTTGGEAFSGSAVVRVK